MSGNSPFLGNYSLGSNGSGDELDLAFKGYGQESLPVDPASTGGAGLLAGAGPAAIMAGGMALKTVADQIDQRRMQRIKNEMERRQRMQELIQAGTTNVGNTMQSNLAALSKALL